MHKLLLACLLLGFIRLAPAQDFRKISWGMTVEEVKKIEDGDVLDENEHMFVYSVQVAGLDALLFYKHIDDKVIQGGYSFQQRYADKNAYITDYEDLKNILTAAYGTPVSDEVLWKNDRFKDEQENLGHAVGMGYLIYWADWDAGNTKIELALHGNNDLHVLAVNYASSDYAASVEKNRRKR